MKKFEIILISLTVLLLPLNLAWSQAKTGTAGAKFLQIGISARAVGMGEAFLGIADDASAIFYNPAGLTWVQGKQAMFTHISYPADIRFEFGSFVLPFPKLGGVLGLGFYVLDAGDILLTDYSYPDEDFSSGQTFSPKDYAVTVSYARFLTDRLSLGLTGKYIAELYGDGLTNVTYGGTENFRATGWAADVGTIYNTGYRGLRIGMIISNFGPDLKFKREGYALPIDFKFGGSIDIVNNHQHRAVFAAELSHPSDNLEKYRAGVEYWFDNWVALRVGNQFSHDDYVGGIALGAGVKLKNLIAKEVKIDYAFQDAGVLSTFHRFSLLLSF
ncbi:MAG TPA: PorV/PorQ family protein [candidate division Zixibacteria bacterium]|nr:PorV/PorQ family protein [candidate division Zixibacteria bacterium]